ncbi:hypothetical protein LCGC14_2809920, partial [marine sediment metagenome]
MDATTNTNKTTETEHAMNTQIIRDATDLAGSIRGAGDWGNRTINHDALSDAVAAG